MGSDMMGDPMEVFLALVAALVVRDMIRAWARHQVVHWSRHGYMFQQTSGSSKMGRDTRRSIFVRALAGEHLTSRR